MNRVEDDIAMLLFVTFFQKTKKNFICFNKIIVEGATSDFHFKF